MQDAKLPDLMTVKEAAEYIEERDEVICFGGRAVENDAASAHGNLAVLEFAPNSNAATWNTTKYLPMPNPRWSAASVLIRGLIRKGETEACDRMFIIGGRNREGFVAEVDVFNLRYNDWETDWKGLDDGELEQIPASMGGGSGTTIIINNQGGSSNDVQEVLAGENVTITGQRRRPVVNARMRGVYG